MVTKLLAVKRWTPLIDDYLCLILPLSPPFICPIRHKLGSFMGNRVFFQTVRGLKMGKDRKKRAFTLVEIVVVILIIGILAAVMIPIVRGRTEQAKWSEAAGAASYIRATVRAYHAEDPVAAVAMVGSTVDTIQGTLGFASGDLTGRYFQAGNFTITDLDGNGNVTITVAAPAGLTGSGVLSDAGWVYSP